MKKRAIAFMLALIMTWSSLGNLPTGARGTSAKAEGVSPITTDGELKQEEPAGTAGDVLPVPDSAVLGAEKPATTTAERPKQQAETGETAAEPAGEPAGGSSVSEAAAGTAAGDSGAPEAGAGTTAGNSGAPEAAAGTAAGDSGAAEAAVGTAVEQPSGTESTAATETIETPANEKKAEPAVAEEHAAEGAETVKSAEMSTAAVAEETVSAEGSTSKAAEETEVQTVSAPEASEETDVLQNPVKAETATEEMAAEVSEKPASEAEDNIEETKTQEESTTEKKTLEDSGAAEETAEASAVNEAAAEEPTAEEQTVEESGAAAETAEAPAANEPAAEEPTAEEQTVEESTIEAETAEEGPLEESTIETETAEEGTLEESTTEAETAEEGTLEESTIEAETAEEGPLVESTIEAETAEEGTPEESTTEAETAEESTTEAGTAEEETIEESTAEEETVEEPTAETDTFVAAPLVSGVMMLADPVSLAAAGEEEKEGLTVLEAEIEKALAKRAQTDGKLTGLVQVILSKNLRYEGESTITSRGRTVEDDFVLELAAEDAGEDGASGSGTTIIAEDLVIKGINVVLKSVMMAAGKKITLRTGDQDTDNEDRGSQLTVIGAADVPNELNVVIGADSSAEITTGGGNDKITVETAGGAESVTVNAGSGENNVTANLSSGDAEITTGSGKDTVRVDITTGADSQVGDVQVDTGAGVDTITVVNDGRSDGHEIKETDEDDETKTETRNAEIRINAGSGDDNITLDLRSNAGEMTLSTGSGSDTVTVKKGDYNTVENLSYSETYQPYEKTNPNSSSVVTLVNEDEEAMDHVTVDIAVSRAVRGLRLEGGAGANIHLKGELKTGGKAIEKIKEGVKLYTSFGEETHSLEVTSQQAAKGKTTPVYNYTDGLKNKKTVSLYPQKSGTFTYSAKLEDFTDYVIKSQINQLSRIVIRNENTGTPFLSNLVIDQEKTKDGGASSEGDEETGLLIHDVDARPLNVLIKGRAIEIQGHVQAKNVRAESVQGTTDFLTTMGSHTVTSGELMAKMLNLYDSAEIAVRKGAKVEADREIVLLSRVKHFGSMLNVFEYASFSILNIKVASASVGIEGELISHAGSVSADAKVETLTGKNMTAVIGGTTGDIEKAQKKTGDSVGITFIIDDATVTASETAKVTAGQDIYLRSEGKITAYTFADLEKYAVVAVTFINNDVQTKASGILHAGRAVKVTASGTVTDDNEASHRGDRKDGAINNFLAVNIIDQDVGATVSGAQITTDRGDIAVTATGTVTATNIATASSSKKELPNNTSSMSLSGILGAMLPLVSAPVIYCLNESAKRIVNKVNPNYYLNKYNKMLKKVSAGEYDLRVIPLSEEDKEQGNPTVKPKVGEDPEGNEVKLYGVVEPNPADGYVTDRVRYRTLNEEHSGTRYDRYTYTDVLPNQEGKYVFLLEEDNKSVEVIVTYRKKDDPAPAQPPAAGVQENVDVDVMDDAFDINHLILDGEEGMGNDPDEEDEDDDDHLILRKGEQHDLAQLRDAGDFVELEDAEGEDPEYHRLKLVQPEDGNRILTWQTFEDKSLKYVHKGQKIRIVGNANEGKELKKLTVSYVIRDEHDARKTATITVTPDSQGRFIFEVPEISKKKGDDRSITVTPVFGDKSSTSGPAHTQETGAVAFSYVQNEALAVIESARTETVTGGKNPTDILENLKTSVIQAGGSLTVGGFHITSVTTTADGTAITEESLKKPKSGRQEPKYAQEIHWTIPGGDYAVRASSSLDGDLSAVTKEEGDSASVTHPKFTLENLELPEGTEYDREKSTIQISWYTKFNEDLKNGKRVTKEFKLSDEEVSINGETIVFRPDLGDMAVVEGTTLDVSFIFRDKNGNALSTGDGEMEYAIPNPINIIYNHVVEKDGSITSIGSVTYAKTVDDDGKRKIYVAVKPDDSKGYTIKAESEDFALTKKSNSETLFASWVGSDGVTRKKALEQEEYALDGTQLWFFSADDPAAYIPAGALVTIFAVFTEDVRGITLNMDDAKIPDSKKEKGTAEVNMEEAKSGDKVKVTLKPADGWAASGIIVSTVFDQNLNEDDEDDNTLTYSVGLDGNVTFEMPTLESDKDKLVIKPQFKPRDVTVNGTDVALTTTGGKTGGSVMGFTGETITVAPSEELTKQGKKITKIKVNGVEMQATSFTITEEQKKNILVTAEFSDKEFTVGSYTDPQGLGSIEPESGKIDRGETVYLKIKPKDGYRAKYGTVQVTVTTANRSQRFEASWDKENRYKFTLNIDPDEKVESITIKGSFEPGSDGVALSLGLAAGISIVQAESAGEIRGGQVSAEKGITLNSFGRSGKVSTTAKAGYSAGKTGVGGALALQIASSSMSAVIRNPEYELQQARAAADEKKKDGTTVRVKRDADPFIHIGNGALNLAIKADQEFGVTGDASNKSKAEASGTGVGAGLAIAVDKITSVAEVENGVILDRVGGTLSKLTGITIDANLKTKDTVTAKAGAKGGSSWVPVAAVDVYNSSTTSRLGKLNLTAWQKGASALSAEDKAAVNAGMLPVAGAVTVKAATVANKVQYNHELAADASSQGGGTAMGGAFVVTWIKNDVAAELAQGLKAAGTGNITVSSTAAEAVKAVATASAAGGSAGKKSDGGGSADKQANGILNGAAGIAGQHGGMDQNEILKDVKNRQKAETAESSVAGAGSFVLNMQQNLSRAEIPDGVSINAAGKLSVLSSNRTDGTLMANASTTKSNTGVGVGVALNIFIMKNIARIGNGAIQADELEVKAGLTSAPSNIRKVEVAEDMSAFRIQLTESIRSAITEKLGTKYGADILADAVAKTAASLADKLIQDLNLGQLFELIGDDSLGTLENIGTTIWEKLKEMPKVLASPLIDVFEQTVGVGMNMSEEKFQNLLDDVLNTVTTQLFGDAAGILRATVQKSYKAWISKASDAVGNMIWGDGFDPTQLKNAFTSALSNAFSELVNKTVDNVFKRMAVELPLLNETNKRIVKDLYDNSDEIKDNLRKKFFSTIKDYLVSYIDSVFKDQIYDYEPVAAKIKESGFGDFVKEELKDLLKEGTAVLTNAMIDGVLGKIDVAITPQSTSNQHVIKTQAVSGAGAKTSSGAGSLAIAVALMTTRAEIGAGNQQLKVTGRTNISAEETRTVRTQATAAVDARGEADNKDGGGDSDDKNTGGSNAAVETHKTNDEKILINSNTGGGEVRITEAADIYGTTVDLIPAEGYQLKAGDLFVRRWTDVDGMDHEDRVQVFSMGDDDYFISPLQKLDKQWNGRVDTVEVDVVFSEALYKVPAPQVIDDELKNGGVAVTVEDREVRDNKIEAAAKDIVLVTVKRVRGYQNTLVYEYTENGQKKSINNIEHPELFALVSENAKERVYGFRMPGADVSLLKVTLGQFSDEQAAADDRMSQTEAKDGNGRSVGVGAAFALTYGNSDVVSQIGQRAEDQEDENAKDKGRTAGISTGTLSVTASSSHAEQNFATAGTDPFQGTSSDAKDLSVDASLSINILDNDIYAGVTEGTKVTTTGALGKSEAAAAEKKDAKDQKKDSTEKKTGEDEPAKIDVNPGDVVVSATEVSKNETKSDAFATGSTTSVGASVAVNVSLSDIKASLGSGAQAKGKAAVRSHSLNRDNTWSFASVMGADVQRSLNKFADKVDVAEKNANKLSDGTIWDGVAKDEKNTKNTDTSNRITDRLNDQREEDGDRASANLPVSVNVLRSQNAQVDNGEDANDAANGEGGALDELNDAAEDRIGQRVGNQKNPNEKKKVQVAATIGFNLGFHNATTTVGGSVTAEQGDISLTSKNAANFRTRATAAAMSLAETTGGGHNIALAVGISASKNIATTEVTGDLKAKAGSVLVESDLKQNQTDEYHGYLGVQSVSGSVSGKGYDSSVAGALSFLASYAESKTTVRGAKEIEGNSVIVQANDKSKMAIRAGGLNISKGSAVGMGLSLGVIWSADEVKAEITDGVTVTADAFRLRARKEMVSYDDFRWPFKASDVITDSSKLSDAQRENVKTGLIDVHKKPGEKSYTIDFNVNSYSLMNFVDNLNFLSSQNYYAETVGGSLVTGRADPDKANALNAAGSLSLVRALNTVETILGSNVILKKKNENAKETGAEISAVGDTNARMIGGALAVGKAKNTVGVTLTVMWDKDTVSTTVGDNLRLTNGGAVKIASEGATQAQAFNAAAALALDSGATNEQLDSLALGGGLNFVFLENSLNTTVGNDARITGRSAEVSSDADNSLMLVSVSAQGAAYGTAAGGTFALIDDLTVAETKIGDRHLIRAENGDVNIHGAVVDKMMNILASASGASSNNRSGYGDSTGVAGAISLVRSKAKGLVKMGEGGAGHGVQASGNISIYGDADSRGVNVTLAGAGSKGKAVGLSINGNLYSRESGVDLKGGAGYVLKAGGDVMTSAYGNDLSVIIGLAVTAGKEFTLSGNLPVLFSSNKVQNHLGAVQVTAGGEAAFASRLRDQTFVIAGSVAVSVNLQDDGDKDTAVGATAMLVRKKNTIETKLGTSTVQAEGSGGKLYQRMLAEKRLTEEEAFEGIYTGALSDDDLIAVEAGVTVAGSDGVNVNVLFNFNSNTILADAANATLKAASEKNPAKGGSVLVKAGAKSWELALSGGINIGWSNSAGGALVVVDSDKDVKALAKHVQAAKDVRVLADNRDDVYELAVGVGGSTDTLALNVQIAYQGLQSRVNAITGGNILAQTGKFDLHAENNTNLLNTQVALVLASSDFAATPVVGISNFTGETNAILGAGTIRAAMGVDVKARADKDIDQYTIGAAAGTSDTALSGAFSINLLKDHTNAIVQSGANITAGSLNVNAQSNYTDVAASAAVAATSGDGAAAVNVMFSVAKASALAEMEGTAKLTGAASVKATSNRDIINGALTVGGSAGVGVGVTVMVLIAGTRMDQEAANMITYGSSDKQKNKTFDPDNLLKKMKAEGVDVSDLQEQERTESATGEKYKTSGLKEDLEGNGHENSKVQMKGETFDGASGVVDQGAYKDNPDTDADENRQAEDTEDIRNARAMGTTVYSDDFPDAIVARISKNAVVHATGIAVEAEQETKADLFGATVGVGLETAGVGVSFAIAMMRSNVLASAIGTMDAGNGKVSVTAASTAGQVQAKEGSEEAQRNKALEKKLDGGGSILTRSIRVVGLAAGIGGVGVSAVGGVARADNITRATLGGKVTNASAVKVNADSKYDNVLAATVAVSGGLKAALGISVAVAVANGDVRANVDSGASISGKDTDIEVATASVFNVRTLAVTAAGSGQGSVTGGVAISLNSVTQKTGIDRGVTINTSGENGTLKVRGESSTKASSTLLGLTAGGYFGVGLGFAMASVRPTVETTVGINGQGKTELGRLKSAEVSNDISSEASSTLASLTAGMAAISGNVLLVFNDTVAKAQMGSVGGDMDTLRIAGDLDAKGDGLYLGGSAGAVAIGVSVSYVDVHAENRAELLTDEFTARVRGAMTVAANEYNGQQGQKGFDESKIRKSEATAVSVSGAVGGVAGGLNAAVARNRTLNLARIAGKNGVSAETLHLNAYGVGTAKTNMGNAAAGGATVVASVVIALNEAASQASVKVDGAMDASLDAHARMEGKTEAESITGSGSLIGVGVNVVKAKGQTSSLIDVESGKAASKQISILADNGGKNDIKVNILNQTTGLGVIGTMIGLADSKDVYNAAVRLKGGDYRLKDADVHTNYATTTKSVVYPSKAGVDAALIKVTFNMARAKSDAYAGAELELSGGKMTAEGDVNVAVEGESRADTGIESVKYTSLEGLTVSGHTSKAELNTRQAALLRLSDATLTGAKDVRVHSITDGAGTGAAVGASGVDTEPKGSFEIKLASVNMNWATAHNNLQSSAMIVGNGSAKSGISGKTLDVKAALKDGVKTKAESETKTGLELVIFSIGSMNSEATTTDQFHSGIDGVKADFTGPVSVTAKSDTNVLAEGSAPGTISLGGVDLSISDITGKVGQNGAAQTAKVLIGSDTAVHSGSSLLLSAENTGNVKSDFVKRTLFSVGTVKVSSIPTESTYSTGIAIGDGSSLSAEGGMTLNSRSNGGATSTVDSFGLGLGIDVTVMKGKNTITDDNHIDIGNQTTLVSKKDLSVKAATSQQMTAKSKAKGFGIVAGDELQSENTLTRSVGITMGQGTALTAKEGKLELTSLAGEGDNILSDTYVKSGGLVAIGKAKAANTVTTSNIISAGDGIQLRAMKDILLQARSTSRVGSGGKNSPQMPDEGDEEDLALDPSVKPSEDDETDDMNNSIEEKKKKDEKEKAENDSKPEKENTGEEQGDPNAFGIYSHAVVKGGGAGISTTAKAINTLNYTTVISLNRTETGKEKRAILQSDDESVLVRVNNEGLRVKSDTNADGSSALGGSNAWSQNDINLGNTIWVDNANLFAMGGKTELLANTNGSQEAKPYFESYAHGELYALNTKVNSDAILEGLSFNQIKTSNVLGVRTRGEFSHIAQDPRDGIRYYLDAPYNSAYGSGQDKDGKVFAWGGAKYRCDFCVDGQSSPAELTRVINNRNAAQIVKDAFTKALSPLNDIQQQVENVMVYKARYGEEENLRASQIYALNLTSVLERDLELGVTDLADYRLWTNSDTLLDVWLLPNGTRLYGTERNDRIRLRFLSEVMRGDVLDNDGSHEIEIITALTSISFKEPVIPIGSTGSLDFRTGTLKLPALADFELYLHEVSADWFVRKMSEDFFQTILTDIEAANAFALEGKDLPETVKIFNRLVEDGTEAGWKRYWMGDTPETAEDPDQTLIYLLVNEATDEIEAFRTSVRSLQEGQAPVDLSLYLYRDSKADQWGIEKYNIIFFDTPAGKKSLVKVVTDVLMDRVLQVPLPLRVTLRAFELDGADRPAYSIGDHFFAMNDGSEGMVRMLNGYYEAACDGNGFESDYMQVTFGRNGELQITLKDGQTVWFEWTGDDSAQDTMGRRYVMVDDVWYPEAEAPAYRTSLSKLGR